jgi:hypothetical protein
MMPRKRGRQVEPESKLQHRRPLPLNLSLRRLCSRNDTEYLLSSPEMAARLKRALEDSLAGRGREFTMKELYARYGLDWNVR